MLFDATYWYAETMCQIYGVFSFVLLLYSMHTLADTLESCVQTAANAFHTGLEAACI